MPDSPRHGLDLDSMVKSVPGWARAATAVMGVVYLGLGAGAVFATDNSTGSAALIAAGLALVVLAVLADRLESLEGAGLKLQLQAAKAEVEAETKERAAAAAVDAGDDQEARRLRAEADLLRRKARVTGSAYEGLRTRMDPSKERTAQIDRLLRDAAGDLPRIQPGALRELFASGRDGDRVFALRLMHEHPEQADADCLSDAILGSRSATEQWHALRAAERFVAVGTEGDDVDLVRQTVGTGIKVGLISPDDHGRYGIAHRILGSSPDPLPGQG